MKDEKNICIVCSCKLHDLNHAKYTESFLVPNFCISCYEKMLLSKAEYESGAYKTLKELELTEPQQALYHTLRNLHGGDERYARNDWRQVEDVITETRALALDEAILKVEGARIIKDDEFGPLFVAGWNEAIEEVLFRLRALPSLSKTGEYDKEK